MTRMHFEMTASLLCEQRVLLRLSEKRHGIICCLWADELAKTNQRFNRYTFLKACGVL